VGRLGRPEGFSLFVFCGLIFCQFSFRPPVFGEGAVRTGFDFLLPRVL